ncbi:MAG TPA: asparagine--tRNA ligase [Planctomycetota bacterium]|nr:asparagine--tRNA ligase [Planctomycetota bacterium]HRR78666.1 asparagine--tRNA ligase [Planctomycetota bacterium]HRT96981.1 asparagine--tRNA ligase [Planctomycetota bacterium]
MRALEPEHRVKHILARRDFGAAVVVYGWLRSRRDSKELSFLDVNDGSCMAGIQVIADASLPNYEGEVKRLVTGCSVRVEGELRASPGKGQAVEVLAKKLDVLGWVQDPDAYPMQKKRHTFEYLREVAHLRPRSNTFGAIARVRNCLAHATHEFFQGRGFLYVHTPIITASDCEGAGEMFTVTTLDPKEPPRLPDGSVDFSQDFFGRRAFLTVSGQLSVETHCCALTNVYTFGPTFRAENSNTPRHLAEFWMIEPEMAFCDLEGDMDLAEAYIKHLLSAALERCPDDMAFFNQWVDKTVMETLQHIVASAFERITYTEAIEILQKSGESFEFPVEWGRDLQTEHERYLTEKHIRKPVIVRNYPKAIKAFYMRVNDDERTVAAMDVLVPKIGEIIGGSQREERRDVLERRMAEGGLDPRNYWWYLDLRRYGTVPHAGFGLGFERTVQFATGMANIRDAIPFPRTPKSAEF